MSASALIATLFIVLITMLHSEDSPMDIERFESNIWDFFENIGKFCFEYNLVVYYDQKPTNQLNHWEITGQRGTRNLFENNANSLFGVLDSNYAT